LEKGGSYPAWVQEAIIHLVTVILTRHMRHLSTTLGKRRQLSTLDTGESYAAWEQEVLSKEAVINHGNKR
jgi:hypothetical protein